MGYSRERNKIHAKRTREKKKHFIERSEKIIAEMVHEANLLREYLISVKMMTRDEDVRAKLRDIESKEELEILKVSRFKLISIDRVHVGTYL